MFNLVIAFVLGILIDRYGIPVVDALLELYTVVITRIYTKIQIDINLMSKDYQDVCNEELISTNAIGFQADVQQESDDDDEDCKRIKEIGFKK